MRFDGKHVLVLGGSNGIGLAAARGFKTEGAEVIATGRDPLALEKLRGEGITAFASDMGSVADSRALMTKVGEIDVLFVNAGVGGFASIEEASEDFWDGIHNVNLRGAFFAVQAALPHLRDGGSIVITGSIGSVMALPGNVAYAAAKAGLRAVARILAVELLPRRIRVNMVSPGPTDTEIFKRGSSPQDIAALREMMANNVPMKRMGDADEIARAVLFLASDEASFITGIDLFVDGGCVEL